MVKLCENTNVYTHDVQLHQTLKHLKESKFQGLEPRGQHSSAGSMEQAGRQVENWFQLFPCCPRLRCARHLFCLDTELSPHCDSKGDMNTEELNRQSSGQLYGNLESTGPLFSQDE